LIFRIAVRFNPASAIIIGDRNASLQKVALKSVRRNVNFAPEPSDADLIIINDDSADIKSTRDKLVYIFPDTNCGGQSTCERIWSETTRGMRFDNSRGFTIIVHSPTLPRQRFDVRF
ncbi:MAG: hypothetical protein K2M54_07715, partial [Muribaculaceae bacterium]|nr:hypothetical protein [Muribaculaceae bacterium]